MSKADFLYPSRQELKCHEYRMREEIYETTYQTMREDSRNNMFVCACVRQTHRHMEMNVRDIFNRTGLLLELDYVYGIIGHFCYSEKLDSLMTIAIIACTPQQHNNLVKRVLKNVHPLHGPESGSSSSSSSNDGDE